MLFADFTNGKDIIFLIAFWSTVSIKIWFSHFDSLSTFTSPVNRTLSLYFAVTGKSVLSKGILYRLRRSIALAERNSEGLAKLKVLPPLSVNCTINFGYWALAGKT